jgi:hypothetical protein
MDRHPRGRLSCRDRAALKESPALAPL